MKIFVIIIALLLLVCSPITSQAQTNTKPQARNRIKIAYGDASYILLTNLFLEGGPFRRHRELSSSGSISLGYRRLIGNSKFTA